MTNTVIQTKGVLPALLYLDMLLLPLLLLLFECSPLLVAPGPLGCQLLTLALS